MLQYDEDSRQRASPREQEAFLWVAAWDFQRTTPLRLVVDVDLECLGLLEERMFENSGRVGASGNQQWGLDVGAHQALWNPYTDLPMEWEKNDRGSHDSEDEIMVHIYSS
ncbi:hypothetical protein FIBSPDRAFT_738735 [Athelia psychrophila]|uniref:Uncharacterized protein n=2 Tax=Athelia psychrophila TaxID=1759441 RepID=A0A166L5E4_9AGAM|nr:hypothetical protein FIBSPDRAFT_738735 [Fibularhizoctonia sp. CBS 109695]